MYSLKSLNEAISIMDRSIANIEKNGFNIMRYNPISETDTRICYIGNVCYAAGLEYASLTREKTLIDICAKAGIDPNAVLLAFSILDEFARPLVMKSQPDIDHSNHAPGGNNWWPGYLIERYGFRVTERAGESGAIDHEHDARHALGAFAEARATLVKMRDALFSEFSVEETHEQERELVCS